MAKREKIKDLALDEITGKLDDLETELRNLRYQRNIGQVENNQQPKMIKRDIARCKTLLNEMKRGIRSTGKSEKGIK